MDEETLLKRAVSISDWIIDLRRAIHRQPELSYEERETAALVAAALRGLGLEVREGVGGHGVTGLLRGAPDGKTVALRADMDALPVQELNDVPYRSQRAGCMHACGHDGHTAMLLGAARLLAQAPARLPGSVKFLFQPAEEVPPEGGARRMIADQALQDPQVDAIFSLHIWPDLPAGKVGVKPGPIMAAPDRMHLTIRGRGGHGATPHRTTDVIVTAAQVILGLQTLVSRRLDPLLPAVLSICRVQAGSAYNILPDEIYLEGTTRYFDRDLGRIIREQIELTAAGICAANDCTHVLDYQHGFPPTISDPEMAALVEQAATRALGANNVIQLQEPSMTGEDFSYFLEQVPGCYFWLGTRNAEKGIVYPLHSGRFQIDEDILPRGAAVLAETALAYLNR